MKLGPFYEGQIPASPLVITIKDPVSDTAKDLTDYTGAELKLRAPDGTSVDTTDGNASISDAANGEVTYIWPSTTLFNQSGTFEFQLVLTGNLINDYTSMESFTVKEPIS